MLTKVLTFLIIGSVDVVALLSQPLNVPVSEFFVVAPCYYIVHCFWVVKDVAKLPRGKDFSACIRGFIGILDQHIPIL